MIASAGLKRVSTTTTNSSQRAEDPAKQAPEPQRELNNKFDDLDRTMQLAVKCRFKASRRLRSHKQIAQVTIALLSLELIIVPTLLLGGLKTQFSPGMTAAIQICAAAFVLVYSLLIGGGEFSLKEHKHHQCGLEINALVRRLKPFSQVVSVFPALIFATFAFPLIALTSTFPPSGLMKSCPAVPVLVRIQSGWSAATMSSAT